MKYYTLKKGFTHIIKTAIFFICCFKLQIGNAQTTLLDKKISIIFKEETLPEALTKIESQLNCIFSYTPTSIKIDRRLNQKYTKVSLRKILNEILAEYKIYYRLRGNTIYMQTDAEKGKIIGKITASDNTPIPYVSIFLKGTTYGASTDENGNFSFYAPEGNYRIILSSIGFKSIEKTVTIVSNSIRKFNFKLSETLENLNEVVISAGRTPEKLSEIPASITTLNSKQIKSLTISTTNIADILEFSVPGLAPSTGTFSSWGQTLRGRRLLVMIDGIPQSTPLRNGQVDLKSIHPNDISKIEVIKGAVAIYGNGGDGGIVNYITKKAPSNTTFIGNSNIWTTSNLFQTRDAFGWGAQQLFSGNLNKLSYYISGNFEKTGNKYDGNRDVLSPTYGLDNTKMFSVLGNIGYQIEDNQTISLMLNHYKSRQESPFVAKRGNLEVFNASGDLQITPTIGVLPTLDNPLSEEAEGVGVTTTNVQLKYTLSEIFKGTTKFETDTYYQKGKNVFFYDATYFEGGGQPVVNTSKFGFRPILNTKFSLGKFFSSSFTYGLDFLKDKTNQGLLDGRIWTPNIDLLSIASFIQAKFKYKESWVFKTGLRQDNMKASIKDFATLPLSPRRDGNYTMPINVTGGKMNFSNTSVNLGIRYIKNDDFIPYISFSQGFYLTRYGKSCKRRRFYKC